MTDSPHTDPLAHDDPFARIDPFVAMIDGRRQLAEAIAAQVDDVATISQQVAEILAIVAAHDEALMEVARAYAQGERNFEGVIVPADRALVVADMDAAMVVRAELFQAVAAIAEALDEIVSTPWGGSDTWRMHLVALAMNDGAHAYALSTTAADSDRDR